jgi:hypothetical protein
MKISTIRALTLGIALAFPTAVFAQTGTGGAAAEKKDSKKAKAKDETKTDASGAAGEKKDTKKAKKSKADKADKATTGAAAKP